MSSTTLHDDGGPPKSALLAMSNLTASVSPVVELLVPADGSVGPVVPVIVPLIVPGFPVNVPLSLSEPPSVLLVDVGASMVGWVPLLVLTVVAVVVCPAVVWPPSPPQPTTASASELVART
ncbi:hypothetical protein [Nannocystis pusilla]|uniref:hypothetical protein n=1 Tax=Nannocystis pusilla TaxID=889268 RepID=UPI003DA40114